MSLSSMNANLTSLSLYQDNSAKTFMLCPACCIISISVAIIESQIVGPGPLPWYIAWKGMGELLCKNYSEILYTVMMWCSMYYNGPSMHFIVCAGMRSCCIFILATELMIQS